MEIFHLHVQKWNQSKQLSVEFTPNFIFGTES